jgi:hypothetical protein
MPIGSSTAVTLFAREPPLQFCGQDAELIEMGLRWAIASVAALVAGASFCAPAQAIVGGSPVASINDRPYQVALLLGNPSSPSALCGGTIRDSTHIITAAHCVFDNAVTAPGQAIDPGQITVLAGTANRVLGTRDATAATPPVVGVSFEPAYGFPANDAAVLTLDPAQALPLAANSAIDSVPVITPQAWTTLEPAPPVLSVSGWGQLGDGTLPNKLQLATDLQHRSDSVCATAYGTVYDSSIMICAGNSSKDSCFGDSGGPLVSPNSPVANQKLVGIVSFGPASGCAIQNAPGVYTEVGNAAINAYVVNPTRGSAPRSTSGPFLTGTAEVGGVLTCQNGAWSGTPSYQYQFARTTNGSTFALGPMGSAQSYTVQSTDVGGAIACIVKASNADGYGTALSGATGLIPTPVTPAPTPAPAPPVQAPTPTPQQDIAAPVARITAKRCTATRCTLTVTVTDSGFSAGISTVQATVRSTYRTTCTRKGRKVSCTKRRSRSLRATSLSSSSFRVVAAKLPVGTQLFTLVAVDRAGHRQVLPTRVTLKTKRAKKRR